MVIYYKNEKKMKGEIKSWFCMVFKYSCYNVINLCQACDSFNANNNNMQQI